MTSITLRPARPADRNQVLLVEKQATPGLQYLPSMFDPFLADPRGEFTIAEIDGTIVACAKFSVLPDGTAWLETIRVAPAHQGKGIGKRFYANYADIAQRERCPSMAMYTGTQNAASKGLATQAGLRVVETFAAVQLPVVAAPRPPDAGFLPVTDTARAVALVMPHADDWGGFLVMNRTFYKLSPALIAHLCRAGSVYARGDSVVVIGARFMPASGLHLGFWNGDTAACLAFAKQLAAAEKVPQLSCLLPRAQAEPLAALVAHGYQQSKAQFIVMETHLG